MEQKDSKMKRNTIYAIIFVVVLIIIGIIIAYAYYNVDTVLKNTPTNINGTTDCIEISYEEKDIINLSYQYPISDEYARENVVPVKVTLKNKCTKNIEPLEYTVTFTSLAENTGYIEDDQIKIRVTKEKETKELIKPTTYLTNLTKITTGNAYTVLTEDLNKRTNVSTYPKKTSYIIDTGTIENNKTVVYEVYIWIDYYEGDRTYKGLNDNTTMDQQFAGAISAIVNVSEEDKFEAVEGPGTKLEGSKGLSYEQIGGMYRYQGTNAEVNNYICINSDSSQCESGDDDMYRIIGVTQEGKIKVIKQTPISDGKGGYIKPQWNANYITTTCTKANGYCAWPYSDIFKTLNGTSEKDTTSFLYSLGNISSKIVSKNWYYGDLTHDNNAASIQASDMYKIETGQAYATYYSGIGSTGTLIQCAKTGSEAQKDSTNCVKWKQMVTPAKIGLMYLHDYGFAVGGITGHTTSCRTNFTDCLNSWIHLTQNGLSSTNEWIMSRLGRRSTDIGYSAWYVYSNGITAGDNLNSTTNVARPVFYLSSDITIKEGTDGSIGNPYIIK